MQVPVIVSLWWISTNGGDPLGTTLGITRAITLFFFLSTSRLGLWIYDLTTQQLTQTMTMPSKRSSFGGVENSFVNLFEFLQNIVAILLHRPEQFKYLAMMSLVAVATSTIMYASWVFKMRGHLVHWDTILKSCERVVMRCRW
jgi:iron-regulated transporter 1